MRYLRSPGFLEEIKEDASLANELAKAKDGLGQIAVIGQKFRDPEFGETI
jgi:hypothetical protein